MHHFFYPSTSSQCIFFVQFVHVQFVLNNDQMKFAYRVDSSTYTTSALIKKIKMQLSELSNNNDDNNPLSVQELLLPQQTTSTTSTISTSNTTTTATQQTTAEQQQQFNDVQAMDHDNEEENENEEYEEEDEDDDGVTVTMMHCGTLGSCSTDYIDPNITIAQAFPTQNVIQFSWSQHTKKITIHWTDMALLESQSIFRQQFEAQLNSDESVQYFSRMIKDEKIICFVQFVTIQYNVFD